MRFIVPCRSGHLAGLSIQRRSVGTHVDRSTGLPTMVDVSSKAVSKRAAIAQSSVYLPPSVVRAMDLERGAAVEGLEFRTKKGPVVATAVVAGTTAVKKTSDLIPFCHPLPIEGCRFNINLVPAGPPPPAVPSGSADHRQHPSSPTSSSPPPPPPPPPGGATISITCEVTTTHKTGVEMEALTGASVAALTIYDMLKGVGDAQLEGMHIGETFLAMKDGGKHGLIRTPKGRGDAESLR